MTCKEGGVGGARERERERGGGNFLGGCCLGGNCPRTDDINYGDFCQFAEMTGTRINCKKPQEVKAYIRKKMLMLA